jgi:hypothetical protein
MFLNWITDFDILTLATWSVSCCLVGSGILGYCCLYVISGKAYAGTKFPLYVVQLLACLIVCAIAGLICVDCAIIDLSSWLCCCRLIWAAVLLLILVGYVLLVWLIWSGTPQIGTSLLGCSSVTLYLLGGWAYLSVSSKYCVFDKCGKWVELDVTKLMEDNGLWAIKDLKIQI